MGRGGGGRVEKGCGGARSEDEIAPMHGGTGEEARRAEETRQKQYQGECCARQAPTLRALASALLFACAAHTKHRIASSISSHRVLHPLFRRSLNGTPQRDRGNGIRHRERRGRRVRLSFSIYHAGTGRVYCMCLLLFVNLFCSIINHESSLSHCQS